MRLQDRLLTTLSVKDICTKNKFPFLIEKSCNQFTIPYLKVSFLLLKIPYSRMTFLQYLALRCSDIKYSYVEINSVGLYAENPFLALKIFAFFFICFVITIICQCLSSQ